MTEIIRSAPRHSHDVVDDYGEDGGYYRFLFLLNHLDATCLGWRDGEFYMNNTQEAEGDLFDESILISEEEAQLYWLGLGGSSWPDINAYLEDERRMNANI